MERRVLLAIALSFLVLFIFQSFFTPPRAPDAFDPGSAGQIGNATGTPLDAARGGEPVAPIAGVTPPGHLSPGTLAAPVPPVAMIVGDTAEREITIDTQKVRAVFTNRGARLRHWWLKEYKNREGQPLDLVPDVIPAPLPHPFSLRVQDAAKTVRLNDSLYRVSGVSGTSVDATAQPVTLTFDLETADGLLAQKTFVLAHDTYLVDFSAQVLDAGQPVNPTIDWGPGLDDEIARQPPGSFLAPNYVYLAQAIYQTQDDVERVAATSITTGSVVDGEFRWAGVDDHYFISTVVQPPSPLHLEYMPVAIPSTTEPPQVGRYVSYSVRFPSPPQNVKFFIGPKQLDVLREVDPALTKSIYFGIFDWLAVPLLGALKWVYGYVGNWGWAIIVLTILINIVMFPLRHKSVVSMRRMQELQPQMKAIQDRYAKYKITDPERQKMNQEVMELYKAKGVNPASGCVPMLLTMPFLFAFYAMLSQAIEIRGAGFGGWIHDLAAADPLYVTPILMGLSMVWQTRITPSTADPTQQKIMMIMPFMFTFIFLGQPSGLAIYWLVSNLWGIGQQYFTNYILGPPKVHTAASKDTKTSQTKDTKGTKGTKVTKGAK